ncbi:MAG: MBL fold metallo-hydrolase [Bacteroidales bacterium]|jgi:phosphoribosyl 1,2-cyclic phosphodiesterase|nr:MBL fold metallo-hydrolase [Bacteroidales bacterium]
MVDFLSLSSGSSGNSYFISNGNSSFLVDAGIGPRTIKKRLAEHGFDIADLKFVLVTHDHSDHIKGLGSLAGRYKLPVYATSRLHKAMRLRLSTAGRLSGCERYAEPGKEFSVDGIKIIPFSVPHDATETVGYYISVDGVDFTFITDAGNPTEEMAEYCKRSRVVVIEANYDTGMLMEGSYPYILKSRVSSDHGHMSNDQCCKLIRSFLNPGIKSIFLCHLSANNNTPQMAYSAIEKTLESMNYIPGRDLNLCCLPRSECSDLFEF